MARTTQETKFLLTARDRTARAFLSAKSNLGGIQSGVTGLQKSIVALAGIGGLGLLVNKIVDVNAEFQTIKSSLKTVTGSTENAARAFDLIEKFAVTTPFDLQQVTESFIKLKAYGLDPSERALSAYGNTASAMGKSLDQMIEAVADAAAGEFERLKEFGIKARKNRDEVTLTFQGVATTIKNEAAAIEGYLRGIGETTFGGAMADQMQNLTPAFSNFRAAVNGLIVEVGEAGLNKTLADLVNSSTAWIESLDADAIADFTGSVLAGFEDIIQSMKWINDHHTKLVELFTINERGSGIPGAGQIPAGSSSYQLGDFNRSNPRPPQSFDEWADAIRENTGALKDQTLGARAG